MPSGSISFRFSSNICLPSLTYLMKSALNHNYFQGVKAVIAKSFERIHRSNLVGMGIIPLCFKTGEDADTLGLTGEERYTIDLPSSVGEIKPGQDVTVVTDNGKSFVCTLRFDTEVMDCVMLCFYRIFISLVKFRLLQNSLVFSSLQVELAYFDHGGILQYVIRNLIKS